MRNHYRWRLMTAGLILLGLAVLTAAPASGAKTAAARILESESRLKKDVFFLASPECEGRGPLTRGLDKAADHIANEFKKAGLKPAQGGDYFQTFSLPGSKLLATPKLVLKGPGGRVIELKPGVQFDAMGLGGSGAVENAPVVFAGYGVSSEPLNYDDFADVNVEGAVVVLLRDVPRATAAEFGVKLKPQAPFVSKLGRAAAKKARAVLFVNGADTVRAGDDVYDFNYTALSNGGEPGKLPTLHVKRSLVQQMLASRSEDLTALEQDIERDFRPRSRELTGWRASLEVKLERSKIPVKNVVGVLEGAGPLAKETVVIGAHYDHLGYGGAGGSLSGSRKMEIHHGADDNGSGTTALLELARRFAEIPNRQGRRLVFIAFSGEELGLLGSKHYCKEPLSPLNDTVAMFNLDMVGRLSQDAKTKKGKLLVEGSNTSKVWPDLLDRLNKKHDFQLVKSANLPPNSDHFSFYQKKIPVLFFWTGYHSDYHRPSDTADKINIEGMRRVADLSEEVIQELATAEKRPDYQEVKVTSSGGGPRGDAPRLGIVPAYDGDGKEGLLIDGTSDNSPASRAGLKKGDRIVKLAGKPVKNIQTYMQIMGGQKKGETLDVGIERDGKPQTVKVKLE